MLWFKHKVPSLLLLPGEEIRYYGEGKKLILIFFISFFLLHFWPFKRKEICIMSLWPVFTEQNQSFKMIWFGIYMVLLLSTQLENKKNPTNQHWVLPKIRFLYLLILRSTLWQITNFNLSLLDKSNRQYIYSCYL